MWSLFSSLRLRVNLEKSVFLFFIIFVFAYAMIFLIDPQLGPTDDVTFLRTLQSNKPLFYYSSDFPYYDQIKGGRFTPLMSLEYNFVAIFSNKPFWYFFYHAVQFVIFAFLLVRILKYSTNNKIFIYLIPVLLFLLPGFTDNWFRLQNHERNVIFFFAILILAYIKYLEQWNIRYLIVSFICVNLALYYKEVSFVAISAFSLANLIFHPKKSNSKFKLFNFILLFSSFIYLIMFYFFILMPGTSFSFLYKPFNLFLTVIKNIFNYTFFSDPILILLVIPLTVQRVYKLVTKKSNYTIFDSFLVAATAYIIPYIILNIYSPYYLLPAYIFALPSLLFFLSKKHFSKLLWKIAFSVVVFLTIFNLIPSGIFFMTGKKYLSVNFNRTIDFLIKDIESRYPEKRANIFLDSTDLGSRKDIHFVFAEYFRFKGLSNKKYDLKSSSKTIFQSGGNWKIKYPFTVFTRIAPSKILKGDYLIVNPFSTNNVDNGYIQSIRKNYKLVFYTRSKLFFPPWNLKTLIKYFLMKNKLIYKQKSFIVNKNLMQSPDFYVFIKK